MCLTAGEEDEELEREAEQAVALQGQGEYMDMQFNNDAGGFDLNFNDHGEQLVCSQYRS